MSIPQPPEPNIPDPFVPDPTPSPLSPDVKNIPPLAGTSSPFIRVDGQNRDIILEALRRWLQYVLMAWTKVWQLTLVKFIKDTETWLNVQITAMWDYIKSFRDYMWEYIDEHTLKSWSATTETGNPGTDAEVTITGTLSDPILNFVIPRGLTGYSWWATPTTIPEGQAQQPVTIPSATPQRPVQVGDFVVSQSTASLGRYARVVQVTEYNAAGVVYQGSLRGPAGADGQDGVAVPGTIQVTTPSLAPGERYVAGVSSPTMSGFSTIEVSAPGVVRVYANEDYLLADSPRPYSVAIDAVRDHGMFLQYRGVAGSLFKTLSPGVQVTRTIDDDPLFLSIENTGAGTTAITVEIALMGFRE